MEAITWTSRSIDHNKFRQREMLRKYSSHKHAIEGIKRQKSHPVLNHAKQLVQINQKHKKIKQASKSFKKTQNQSKIVKQNKILLEKIYYVESNFKTMYDEKFKYVSGSAINFKKQRATSIRQENKKIGDALQNKHIDIKNYKKKMQQEIKQYLVLRNQIRKMKIQSKSQQKKQKTSRHNSKKSQSEKLQNIDKKIVEDTQKQQNFRYPQNQEQNGIAISSINQNSQQQKNICVEQLENQA